MNCLMTAAARAEQDPLIMYGHVWPVGRRVNKLQTPRSSLLHSHRDWNSYLSIQTDNPHLQPLLCFFHAPPLLSDPLTWQIQEEEVEGVRWPHTPKYSIMVLNAKTSISEWCEASVVGLLNHHFFAKSVWNHKHLSTPIWWWGGGVGGGEGVWSCHLFQSPGSQLPCVRCDLFL